MDRLNVGTYKKLLELALSYRGEEVEVNVHAMSTLARNAIHFSSDDTQKPVIIMVPLDHFYSDKSYTRKALEKMADQYTSKKEYIIKLNSDLQFAKKHIAKDKYTLNRIWEPTDEQIRLHEMRHVL